MKRPLLYAAVIIICGIALGLRETRAVIRIAAIMTACCFLISVLDLRDIKEKYHKPAGVYFNKNRIIIVFTAILFSASFFRGAYISQKYNSTEYISFFSYYRATNPGQFDYSTYLKSRGIDNAEKYEKYQDLKESPNKQASGAQRIRRYLEEIFDETLPVKDAGMYKAILLGDKKDVEDETLDLYQRSGISHLLAISGTHFGVIAIGVMAVLKKLFKLKDKAAFFAASGILIAYLFICGAPVSAIRAVTMIIAGFLARCFGRSYCIRSALAFAAALVALIYPYQIFSSGFQLSFGAIAAICYANDVIIKCIERTKLKKRIKKENRLHPILKTIIISATIQIVLLPIIAWNYFTFPPYGIILNLIVIPLMSIIIYSGLLSLVFGLFARIAGIFKVSEMKSLLGIVSTLSAAPGHYMLKFYELLCSAAEKLPFSSVCTGRPSFGHIIIYYLMLLLIVYAMEPRHCNTTGMIISKIVRHHRHNIREARALYFVGNMHARIINSGRLRALILIVMLTANSSLIRYRETSAFYIMALDAGQGDSFYIRAGDKNILIDGGSSSNRNFGERVLEPFLLSRRITNIDMVIVSHIDNDHVSGLKYIMDTGDVRVSRLLLPKAARRDEKYGEIKELIHNDGIIYLEVGMELLKVNASCAGKDETALICIYAGHDLNDTGSDDTNRQSDVLLLKKRNFSMLFTGDMSSEDDIKITKLYELYAHKEKELSNTGGFDSNSPDGITILKVAHHGSKSSSSDFFLDFVKPEYALLSYGKNNRYGHPSEEVINRLSERKIGIISTCENGAVRIDEKGISRFS